MSQSYCVTFGVKTFNKFINSCLNLEYKITRLFKKYKFKDLTLDFKISTVLGFV